MKRLLTLLAFAIITTSFAQLPQFRLLEYTVDCHQGMIHCSIKDSAVSTNGEFFLRYYYSGSWNDLPTGTEVVTVGQTDTFDVTFSGIGQQMHDYDSIQIRYHHYPTLDQYPIKSLYMDCIGVFSIEDVQYTGEVVSTEWYNLSGQKVVDVGTGLYIQLITYDSGRQSWKKILR